MLKRSYRKSGIGVEGGETQEAESLPEDENEVVEMIKLYREDVYAYQDSKQARPFLSAYVFLSAALYFLTEDEKVFTECKNSFSDCNKHAFAELSCLEIFALNSKKESCEKLVSSYKLSTALKTRFNNIFRSKDRKNLHMILFYCVQRKCRRNVRKK